MKSKRSIFILLPLVLLIWGAVVFQFFKFSDKEIGSKSIVNYSVKPLIIKHQDTFGVKVNKRDPFLGKIENNEKPKNLKKIEIPKKIKEELIWPKVQYKGIVSDNKDKIKIYMLIINGKTFLMQKGDEESGIILKDGDRETIYAIYKGELKVIFIK